MLPTFFTTIILLLVSTAVDANNHGQSLDRRSRRSHSPAKRFMDDTGAQTYQSRQLQVRATAGWDYVGCVTDGSARALTGYSTTDSANTPDKCIQTCQQRGYTYAGTQYGNQCACGNELSNGLGEATSESSCSYSCTGDKSAKCGGYYKFSLYKRAVPTTSSMGCYQDGSTRLFTGPTTSSTTMSAESCAYFCSGQGYSYFGTQYGTQCFCSATAPAASKKLDDSRCSTRCAVNDGSLCGGYYTLSVFSISSGVIPTSSSAAPSSSSTISARPSATSNASTTSAPSASATTSPSGTTSIGCFTDSSSSRLLSGTKRVAGTNSLAACSSFCASAGYKYFGVEYGTECYCGNSYDSKKTADASQCRYACPGDSSQICGGYGVMNLYSIAPALISATTSVASTTSIASTTSSAAPSATSVGALYSLGCYQDGTPRIFDGPSRTDSALTPSSCAAWCVGQGSQWTIFGLEYGNECRCGSAVSSSKKISDSKCLMGCAGDKSQICGNTYIASVYQIGGTPPTPTTPTIGCNAACTSVVGVAAPAAGGGNKYLWAHHMVGNTYSYTADTWSDDINLAASGGFDGFALNHGSSDWQFDRMEDAYNVADAQGSFKLFLSIDVTAIGCGSTNDAQTISSLILRYANHSSQAIYQNKTLVSTFAGDNCAFGQGNAASGWNYVRSLVRAGGKEMYLIPAIFVDPNNFKSMTWFDGVFNWDSAWPIGNAGAAPLTTASDEAWLAQLSGRGYMASVSPLFFTYYGPNSWNKDWIYRSDDWLIARRFEQLASLRDRMDMAEFVTWNDYGESSYIGPIRADQPNSQGWVNGFPHTAWLSLVRYYAQGFKYGSYPQITTDQLWVWSRPHPKAANPTNPTNPRPNYWQTTDDNLYGLVLLSAPATVTLYSGGNAGVWELKAGVNKLSIASDLGVIGMKVERNGKTVKSFDSTGQFSYTDKPVDYNYNYWLGSA